MQHYTEEQLSELIKTVETEFNTFLAKSESASSTQEAPLTKAEDKKEEKPEEKKEEKKEEKPSEKPSEKSSEEKPAEHKEAKPEEKKDAPPAEEKPAEHKEAAPSADGCDYDEEDHAHMGKMYQSMSRGELKAHHDAVRGALDKCGEMSMAKSEAIVPEVTIPTETKPVETDLLKSELESEKAKFAELKKNFDAVQEILTKIVKKVPQGKAITSLDVVAKSEGTQQTQELSKSEVTAVLLKKTADPSLSKADREAINSYYLGNSNINTISHLLN